MIRKLLLIIALSAIPLWSQQIGQPGQLMVSCNAVTTTGACTAFAVNAPQASTFTWQTTETGSPSGVTVNLEGSLDGSTWSTIDTTSSTSGSFQTKAGVPVRQIRCNVATLSGGSSPTVTCQMTISATSGGGGGGGSGTVTSVGITQTGSLFTIGGSPVTTSGNINLNFTGTLPAANGGTAQLTTANQGFWIVPADVASLSNAAANSSAFGSANTLRVEMVVLHDTITINAAAINVSTTSSTNHEYIGIYNAACSTLLLQASFTLGAGTGALAGTLSPSSVTLNPGAYWIARSADQTTSVISGYTNSLTGLSNMGATLLATAANSTSAGVLPSSCGTLTPSTAFNFHIVKFNP